MTIPIKIQCECGQHYAFDVEADVELEPNTVACPACGIDGTVTANAMIAQSLAAQPAVANVSVRQRIRIAAPPAAQAAPAPVTRARGNAPAAGPANLTQAEHEARAKILWGDPPDDVIKFLMIRGFSHEEASGKVRVMFQERLRTVRGAGIGKILTGIFMTIGATSTFLLLFRVGFTSVWVLGSLGLAGVSGLWMILTGTLKVLAPKTESGDASEND